MNESIADLWNRIEEGLSRFKFDLSERLNPPAPQSAIDEFQLKFDFFLPKDLVESLLIHNGESVQPNSIFQYQFCSLELMGQIILNFRAVLGLGRRIDSLYTQSIPTNSVRRDIDWSAGWLPVMYEQGSGLVCDFDPAENGEIGQIVGMHWLPDGVARSVVFRNFRCLMTAIADTANDSNTTLSESGVIYLDTE